MATGANLVVETNKDVTVVTFRDAQLLDAVPIQNAGLALYDLVERRHCTRIVLDFGNVTSLSSSMLGVLLTLKGKLDDVGGRMVLCGLAKDLRRLFDLTALSRLFHFTPDVDQAMALLGVNAAG